MHDQEHVGHVLVQGLVRAIRDAHDMGAYGTVVTGIDEIPLERFLAELGQFGEVFVSAVGADTRLVSVARAAGWDEKHFGIGATHAVKVRNEAPPEAIKVALVWREEERLHSLTRRGYAVIGPRQVIQRICRMAREMHELNTPQQALWEALEDEELEGIISLDGLLKYYCEMFLRGVPDQDSPRRLLPYLGLLKDPLLLTRGYNTAERIVKRLRHNAEIVERLQRADEEDRHRALTYLRNASHPQAMVAYRAFLCLSRGEPEGLWELDLPTAEELLGVSHSKTKHKPATDSEETSNNGPSPRKSRPKRVFRGLDVATISLLVEVEDGRDSVEALVSEAIDRLKEGELRDQAKLTEEDIEVQFQPDRRALALTQLIGTDRFGGNLEVRDHPLESVLADLNKFVRDAEVFNSIWLEEFKDLLARASQRISTSFQGRQYLEQYLLERQELLQRVNLNLLTTAPVTCLLCQDGVLEQAQRVVEAYQYLLAHMDEHYGILKRQSPDGTADIYRRLLSLDMFIVHGNDESAVLLLPTNPLVLWKYVEVARLVQSKGTTLKQDELHVLLTKLEELPEPLSAFYMPGVRPNEELAFTDRLGAISIYRPVSIVPMDVSADTIKTAATKLAALYPPVRENLRILMVDPVTTHHLSRAVRDLIDGGVVQKCTVVIALTGDNRRRQIPSDPDLDDLVRENSLLIEESRVPTARELAKHLSERPVHLLVLSGERLMTVDTIESEGSRFHPLSFPHRLTADPIKEQVSLSPRSLGPDGTDVRHPFGRFQSICTQMSGKQRYEYTLRESRRVSLEECKDLLPYCQLLLTTGDVSELQKYQDLLWLVRTADVTGDVVVTPYKKRIITGIKSLLQTLNYRPTEAGLDLLLKRLQEFGGQGLFATISDEDVSGFSPSALRGQMGLAVALSWYAEQTDDERYVVVSLDSPLAQRWLYGSRESKRRSDVLGIRQPMDRQVVVDLIEVKSYKSTSEKMSGDDEAVEQLLATAKVVQQILTSQGDLLTDCRRELLRFQIFREGLRLRRKVDPDWVELLNEIIDGEHRDIQFNFVVLELAFDENIAKTEEVQYVKVGYEDTLIRRVRLGEQQIQHYLGDLGRSTAAQETELQPVDTSYLQGESRPIQKEQGPSAITAEKEEESPAIATEEEHQSPAIAAESSPPYGTVGEPSPGQALTEDERAEIERMARNIYRVLQDLGVRLAEEVDPSIVDVGPSVVRYKVRLRIGERLATLQNRSKDLMRELALEAEPFIDNLPNTNYVYIDVPRKHRRPAPLRPVLESASGLSQPGLHVPVGVTPDGNVHWVDLTALPHMLVAGSTGSGKTMFLYSLIVSLVWFYRPEDLHLILVDPKETDFVYFNGLPHLGGRPVITDPEAAVTEMMNLITQELAHRTQRLTTAMARDIRSYNQKVPGDRLAPIVVVVDEFADLADVMSDSQREQFDTAVRRLAQRARNVGIHLVIATQRPSADIVSGVLKSNLPCRVSFRLASQVDSRTILDQGGAEKLLGNGDMLFSWNGRVVRLQGFYVPEEEIMELLGRF